VILTQKKAMSEALPHYAVYAVRYATRDARRTDHFIGGDPHDAPMPMDYFVWAIVGDAGAIVVDTGFTEEVAKRRGGRNYLRCPVQALEKLGISADSVQDLILTHLHYDHAGNFDRFPSARFHLQESELNYATGRYMQYPRLSHSFEVEDVCGLVRLNYQRRVYFHNGQGDIAPGITVHHAGGHSAGLQCVRVHTKRGWVVLASDVSHFYENFESERPFTTAFHVGEMLEGFDLIRSLASSPAHIVPGHDPEVMKRYPAVSAEFEGVAVRLDESPISVKSP
jgi:glyoxylase-like metal-dependent hydrolase (beta-lactamase superfamily II)